MPKIEFEEQERIDLLNYLDTLLGSEKPLFSGAGTVMADVEAVRNAAFSDPEEAAIRRDNLKWALHASKKQMLFEPRPSYDDLVMDAIESQEWEN